MKYSLVALAFGLLWIGEAHADVIPPDVAACQNKALGDECTAQEVEVLYTGTCEDGEYCHLNYGCDAGGAPCGTICNPALVCKEGKVVAKDDGGCAVSSTGRTVSTVSFLLGFALLFLLRRRR